MQPVAPPTKKMKAVSENDKMDIETVDAVKKRREELNRLRQKQQMRTHEKTTPGGDKVTVTSSQGLLAHARSQLHASAGPPKTGNAPPAAPGAVPLGRARHSDIFPTVDKVARNLGEPPRSNKAPHPPRPGPMQGPPGGTGRPVEPVVRRLDQSFGQGKSPSGASDARAKSAPPARPPPPPPGLPPLAQEFPASTTPSRSFAARPPPLTPAESKPSVEKPLLPPPLSSSNKEASPSVLTPHAPRGSALTPPLILNPAKPVHSESSPIPQSPTVVESAQHAETQKSTGKMAVANESAKPSTTFRAPAPVPFPVASFPPQQPRQELIRNLHQIAATPGKQESTPEPSKHESSLLRLEKEVREHEKAKADALRKVAVLEEQVQKLKEKGDPEEELGQLVQMADKEGEIAALQWARQKISGVTPRSSTPQVPTLDLPEKYVCLSGALIV